MDTKDALDLYLTSVDSAMSLWNFLFTVAIGLVGFIASVDAAKLRNAFYPVLGAFILVAGVNFFVLSQAHQRRIVIYKVFIDEATPKHDSRVAEAFRPTPAAIVYGSHIAVDILTLLTLTMLYRMRIPTKHGELTPQG